MADSPRPDPLAFLLERGVVTPSQLEESRRACAHPEDDSSVLSDLVARGILDRGELAALRSQVPTPPTKVASPTVLKPDGLERAEIPRPADGDREWGKWTAAEGAPRRLGRFEILGILGQGGMGTVLKAYDPQLGRTVAIKGIQGAVTGLDDPLAERFRREARAAARVRHPSIIPIHEVGEFDGQAFIVMEYIEGRPLCEHLRASGGGHREGAQLLRQIADAVAAAHREGVLHRDLKPDNIMVDASGRPYVVDFGLARDIDPAAAPRLTASGDVVGTPAYMAPEQARGLHDLIGPRSDVYGLGAILYEMLAGRPPFAATDMHELLLRVAAVEPEPPSRTCAGVPRDLETICLRCLEKDPDRRYAGAAELAQDLDRFLRGEALEARRVTAAGRAWRWALRHRRAWLATGALLLAAAAVVGWGRLARAEAAKRAGALLERVAAAARGLEDAVRRTPLTPEARAELERQPLGLLEELIAQEPALGPAYAWRGKVHALVGRSREAQEDFDRACELAPDRPIVWCLRGLDRIARYARQRGLPQAVGSPGGIRFLPAPALGPMLDLLCKAGLDDLGRMSAEAHDDPQLDAADLSLGRGLAALHSGEADGLARALREVDGLSRPAALRVRAAAFYNLRRFAEAETTYEEMLGIWPEDSDAWSELGSARLAAGLAARVAGRDPRGTLRRAIDAFDRVLSRDADAIQAWNRRSIVRVILGEEEEWRGIDPRDLYRGAVNDGRQVVRLWASPEAHVTLGTALIYLGRAEGERGGDPRAGLREAVSVLDTALKHAPECALAQGNRAEALTCLAMEETARGNDAGAYFARAIADADAALRADTELTWAYVTRGHARFWSALADLGRGRDPRQQLRQAVEDYGLALKFDSSLTLAHSALAFALRELGLAESAHGSDPMPAWRRAVSECDDGLHRFPEDVAMLVLRAKIRADAGRTEALAGRDAREWLQSAQADADEAVRLGPESPRALEARGSLFLQRAQLEAAAGADTAVSVKAAIADLSEALRHNPGFHEARIARGTAYWCLAQREAASNADPREAYRLAVADASAALERNPASTAAYNNRGMAGLFLADAEDRFGGDGREIFARAIADCNQALSLDPSLLPALNNRAGAHLGLGMAHARRNEDPREEYTRAEEDYRAAIARNNLTAWLNLGLLLRTVGRFEEAIEAFQTGGRAFPTRAAWIKLRIEETREAMKAKAEADHH